MGATPSVQRDAKSPEDAPEDAVIAEVNDTRDGENVDDKVTLWQNCNFFRHRGRFRYVLAYVYPFGTS